MFNRAPEIAAVPAAAAEAPGRRVVQEYHCRESCVQKRRVWGNCCRHRDEVDSLESTGTGP